MVFVKLEDLIDLVEVLFFLSVYEKYFYLIKEDMIVLIEVKVIFREDEGVKVIV